MNILTIILARGGSKGIPRKNLALLGDEPLINHIIKAALKSKFNTEVVLSTEDEEIAEVARKAGASVPFMRPESLAGDRTTSLAAIQHAVAELERMHARRYDIILHLQPTAPFCRHEDIDACVEKLIAYPQADSVVSITPVGTHPFKMKRLIDGSRVVNYIDQGFEDLRSRQSLPEVYRRSGAIYVSRRDVVMEENTLIGDHCLGVVVPPETALDIDSLMDLEFANYLLKRSLEK